VDSLPGVERRFSPTGTAYHLDHKIDGDQWLDTARLAHEVPEVQCTMLYGHIENDEDRVDHLLKLRALQDERAASRLSSRSRFIRPILLCSICRLPRHARHQADRGQPSGARISPRQSYWQMMTPKIAQIPALWRRRH